MRDFDIVPEFAKYKFQVVLYEEVALKKLFGPARLEQTKTLFERKGITLEAKNQ
jgi:hypothetical protein